MLHTPTVCCLFSKGDEIYIRRQISDNPWMWFPSLTFWTFHHRLRTGLFSSTAPDHTHLGQRAAVVISDPICENQTP